MEETPRTWRGLLSRFKETPKDVQEYFKFLPQLMEAFPWEIALTYMFYRVELAHNMTIYCGVVKLHRCESDLTWKVLQDYRISRQEFRNLFTNVFGEPINKEIYSSLAAAEKIRDRVVHGKAVTAKEIRTAVVDILSFAVDFNDLVYSLAKFRPYGRLQGFKGPIQPLDRATTRWILKGMGFSVK